MENERKDNLAATEEHAPVAFSDWTRKLTFDRSFAAKLILSDDKTKEFYVDVAKALLSYDKIRSRTSWSGVSFILGREKVAYISIIGKTLCVYLAVDPKEDEGRYRAKDVSRIKSKAKTPSLFKVRSLGAKNNLLKRVDEFAASKNLTKKEGASESVSFGAFKADSFNNLITRGLIRIVRNNPKEGYRGAVAKARRDGAYADAVETLDSLVERQGVFNDILKSFSEGDSAARLSKRQILRSIDEIWVRTIEDCVTAIDELIRNPNHFIAESEEVLPIERTKRISGRSIAHLCRHTDYLSVKENGEMTPTKMLNVFREDSILTYENKFLNTLINRLYIFVNGRYRVAQEYGADETCDLFEFETKFSSGNGKGVVKTTIEYSEKNLNADSKKVVWGTGLWKRVQRLNDIVTAYANSSFAKLMGRNFIRPPVLRTNAILKNKYFRECLALWEFIESYDDAGYGIVAEEKEAEISDEYARSAYASAAIGYLLFKKATDGEFEFDGETTEIRPELVLNRLEKEDYEEEVALDEFDGEIDDDLSFALDVALKADEEVGDANLFETFLKKTFRAKLSAADDSLKKRFVDVCNELTKFDKVKVRFGKKYASIYRGRKTIVRLAIGGKTLKAYFALNLSDVPSSFNAADVSNKKTFADTPVCLKIRGGRSAKRAAKICQIIAEEYGLEKLKKDFKRMEISDFPNESLADMFEKGWISFQKKKSFGFDSRSALGSRSTFGSVKNERTEILAKAVEDFVVFEPKKALEAVENDRKEEFEINEEVEAIAKKISSLARPSGNYETPTEYGLDDSSGFIADSEQENEGVDGK